MDSRICAGQCEIGKVLGGRTLPCCGSFCNPVLIWSSGADSQSSEEVPEDNKGTLQDDGEAAVISAIRRHMQQELWTNNYRIAFEPRTEAQSRCMLDYGTVLGIVVRVALLMYIVSIPNLCSPLAPACLSPKPCLSVNSRFSLQPTLVKPSPMLCNAKHMIQSRHRHSMRSSQLSNP